MATARELLCWATPFCLPFFHFKARNIWEHGWFEVAKTKATSWSYVGTILSSPNSLLSSCSMHPITQTKNARHRTEPNGPGLQDGRRRRWHLHWEAHVATDLEIIPWVAQWTQWHVVQWILMDLPWGLKRQNLSMGFKDIQGALHLKPKNLQRKAQEKKNETLNKARSVGTWDWL